jgi:hypothetical protein
MAKFNLNMEKLKLIHPNHQAIEALIYIPRVFLAYTTGFDIWKLGETRRVVHVCLGAGCPHLKRGHPGGHIINDIELPDLSYMQDAHSIQFDWKRAFNRLMREEIMMQVELDQFLAGAITKLKTNQKRPTST